MRQLQDDKVSIADKTKEWMNSLSLLKSNLDENGMMIDVNRSNTGHTFLNVDGSVSMFIMMNFFLLTFGIIFLSHRIYIGKKYMNDKKSQEIRKSKYLDDGIEVEALDQESQPVDQNRNSQLQTKLPNNPQSMR